jgi:hypothetical protein
MGIKVKFKFKQLVAVDYSFVGWLECNENQRGFRYTQPILLRDID